MKSKGVDPNLSTARTRSADETNTPQAPEDVAALEDVTASEEEDPAAGFDDDVGGMSFLGGGEAAADEGMSVTPAEERLQEAGRTLAGELEGAALENQRVGAAAAEVSEELGVCYADAGEDLTDAAEAASDGRLEDASAQLRAGAEKLRDALDFIADSLGDAGRLTPGVREYLTIRDAIRDAKKVGNAIADAPDKAREVLEDTRALLSDLDGATERVGEAFEAAGEEVSERIDKLRPGESVKITVGGGAGAGGASGGTEQSVVVARLPDGSFVIESESKGGLGVGKERGNNEVSAKGEASAKIQWSAKDADGARNLAAAIGAGKLLGKEEVVQAAMLSRMPERLKSIELSGGPAVALAGSLGGNAFANAAAMIGGEGAASVKLSFENGELRQWEASVATKLKGEVALKLGEKMTGGAVTGGVEIQQSMKVSGRLAPGADPVGLLTGDTSSFRSEGKVTTQAQLSVDVRDGHGGVKIEGAVSGEELGKVAEALRRGDIAAAGEALANMESSTTVTPYERRSTAFQGSIDVGAGDAELVGKYDRVQEGDSQKSQGPFAAQVREAFAAMLTMRRRREAMNKQLAAGRSLVK